MNFMKKNFLPLYFAGLLFFPVWAGAQHQGEIEEDFQENQQQYTHHASLPQSALAWQKVFVSLVQQQDWEKAAMIAPWGKTIFKDEAIWGDQQFLPIWNQWVSQHALTSWAIDDDGRGMWRSSEASHNDVLMGIRKEQDSSWWVVIGKPKGAWACPASGCVLRIDTGLRTLTLAGRPPLGTKWNDVNAIGALLPANDLKDQEQFWTITVAGDSTPHVFDVSYARRVCQQKMPSCF